MNLRIWISMKARKTIMKRGSFDNYLLNTRPAHIDSKFGVYLRDLMKKKLASPNTFRMPIIAGHNTQAKTRKTKYWEYRNVPSVYVPSTVKVSDEQN